VRGVSRLWLISLVLGALIMGALASYLWMMGWYVTLQIRVPETAVLNIENVDFNPQNTTFFNVTLLHPSFSRSKSVTVNRFSVLTEDNVVHDAASEPPLPYPMPITENRTFTVRWNWANYTGKVIRVMAFVAEGSGATFQARAPLVNLILSARFNSTISIKHFNMSVQNSEASITHVNITDVTIEGEHILPENVTMDGKPISFPHTLQQNESLSLTLLWDWTSYQGRNITVTVQTLQGYVKYHTSALPPPAFLSITEVLFDAADSTHFSVTVRNGETSPTYVNVTRISVTLEDGTIREIAEVKPSLTPSYTLHTNASETFVCSWNWTYYRGKSATVTLYTTQGFATHGRKITPAPILLKITEVISNPADASHFNITVLNSKFSLDSANITRITVAVENVTQETEIQYMLPPLPVILQQDKDILLTCAWIWTDYKGKVVRITVYTADGYEASILYTLPSG